MPLLHRKKTVGLRAGTTLVEFSVIFPIVMLLVLGLFEMSSLYRVRSGLQTALSKAIREASILTSARDDIEEEIRQHLLTIGVTKPEIKVNPAIVDRLTSEIEITVTVNADPENGFFVYKFFGGALSNSVVFQRP